MNISQLKKAMTKKRPKNTGIGRDQWVNSGLTQLNLAASGHPDRGIARGLCYNLVGDSSAGKTVLAMTIAAEIANDERFDDYEIVYEPAENGAHINIRKFYGRRLAERIRPLRGTWLEPKPCRYLEEFYDLLDELHAAGKPYYCALDSMDVLVPKADLKHAKKVKNAEQAGKEAKGTYGTDKAKINSAKLRVATSRLPETGSILNIISQTRHNIGWGSQFNPKTMAGGDAIKFYSRLQLWLSVVGTKTEKIGTSKVKVGQFVQAKVTKNHLSGWEGTFTFPVFKGVGIDDLGACVDFLCNYGHWKRSAGKNRDVTAGKITATEFDVTKGREALIQYIITMEKQEELRKIVAQVWEEVEEKTSVKRESKYE